MNPAGRLLRWLASGGQLLRGGLLLGLPAFFVAHRANAQHLSPGSGLSVDNVYPEPDAAVHSRRHVRTVLLLRQAPDHRGVAQPAPLTPVSYRQLDAQGRVVGQRWADDGRLEHRMEIDYDHHDQLTSATTYHRLDDPTDTTRLGRVWLPVSCTRYAPLPGTGLAATWNEDTGDWRPYEQYRAWQRHDTTYLDTRPLRSADHSTLERTYYVGAGQRLWRQDKLQFKNNKLATAEYTYVRLRRQFVLEMGQLDFQREFIDYVTTHPDAQVLSAEEPAAWQDELARHAAGHPLPQLTQVTDAHGWVTSQQLSSLYAAYGLHTTYQRDARGRLQQRQQYRHGKLLELTRYTYLSNGLLAQASTFDQHGRPAGTVYYRYEYTGN